MNDVTGSSTTLRSTLYGLHSLLYEFSLTLLRSTSDVKTAFLDEIAYIISINSRRTQMHVDKGTVSSDGFMNNLCATLLRLSEPFTTSEQSKVRFLLYIGDNPYMEPSGVSYHGCLIISFHGIE